jgi:hypothetical protein
MIVAELEFDGLAPLDTQELTQTLGITKLLRFRSEKRKARLTIESCFTPEQLEHAMKPIGFLSLTVIKDGEAELVPSA